MEETETMQYLNTEKSNQKDILDNKYFKIPNVRRQSNMGLNLPSNPQYDPSKPINKKLSFSEIKLLDLKENKKISASIILKKIEYWTTIFSISINYSSLWRFPYYFMLCKGAIFFIPFLSFFFILGIPLLTIESSLGQIFKEGPIEIFIRIKRKYFGLGLLTSIISFIINIYFNIIMTWFIFFFFNSFKFPLPWNFDLKNDSVKNKFYHLSFFKQRILNNLNSDEDHLFNFTSLGKINRSLLFCLIISWILIFLANYFNFRINSKTSFITCIIPIFFLFILFINTFSLVYGLNKGFLYFLIPKFNLIFDYKTYLYGLNQAIFLLTLGNGKNIIFSASKKEEEDIYRRSTLIALITLIIGLISTFIHCEYAGYISYQLNIENISELPFNKASFPFVVYPLTVGIMNYSHLWSLLFFLNMIIINIQNQILQMDFLCKYIQKEIFKNYISFNNTYLIICFIGFILGIPFITDNGFFLLEWIDRYISMVPIFTIIIMEIFIITKNIKIHVLKEIIANITGYVIPGYIFFSVSFITPFVMIIMIVFSVYYHISNIPDWNIIIILQWGIIVLPFIIIVFFFVFLSNNNNNNNNEEYQKFMKFKTINVLNDALEIKNENKRFEMHNI